MWKTKDDAVKDLNAFNHFGNTNERELREALSPGNLIPPPAPPESDGFVDPRTGQLIDISQLESAEDGMSSKSKGTSTGMGRGKLMRGQKDYMLLEQQLRMNRPLGFGNSMIESYFSKYNGIDSTSDSSSEDKCDEGRNSGEQCDNLPKGDVRRKKKSGMKNALMDGLPSKKD